MLTWHKYITIVSGQCSRLTKVLSKASMDNGHVIFRFSEFTEAVWLTSKWTLYDGLIPIFKGDICNWFLVCCRLLSLICFKFWNITLLLFNITWLILDHLVIESCNWNPTNWLAVRPNIDWFWLLNCTYCVSVSFLTTYALSLAPFWQLIDWRLKLFDC